MSDSTPRRAGALTHAPIFFSFFTWGFGTGAQNLGRPLFAFAVTGNVFLVGVLLASNAVPRIFTGPLTGFLADRFGRKPLVILGPIIRGLSNVGQFMADDYITFLALEMIGQVGVAMWGTSSNVLMSDVTRTESRGRMLALRQMSMRLGFVLGPAVGGVLAALYGLQSVFLLNGVSKIVIVVVVLLMVKETRPEETVERPAGERRVFSLSPFRDRSFLIIGVATAAFAMSNAGIMQTLIPVYAVDAAMVDEAAVGFLISAGSMITFLFAFPNGVISDRYGRKWSLIPGLLLLAAASFILTIGGFYVALVVAVCVKGLGESMAMGTTQTYAMDIAPAAQRGVYLGLWTFSQSVGATAGPLLLAALYQYVFPNAAFYIAGVALLATGLLAFSARETAGRRRAS